MTNAMHEAIKGNVVLLPVDKDGVVIKNGPKLSAKPDHWNDGHPVGALLEREHEFDATRLTSAIHIAGWKMRNSAGRDLGSFMMAAPMLIEPGTMVKLSKAVLVPRGAIAGADAE